MDSPLDQFIAQLEDYLQRTQAQINANVPDEARYWQGVRFGLELAILEARKQLPSKDAASSDTSPADNHDDEINRLIFEQLDHLITVCQAPIKRDLLVYNVRMTRYELLKAIRQLAGDASPSEYELQASAELMKSSSRDQE